MKFGKKEQRKTPPFPTGKTLFILLLLVFGFLVVALSPRYPRPARADFEILYTKDGFSPSSLEVPIGSRVSFKNTTDIPLWTASDPHPTHSDYPEFDAHRDYLPSELYTFQFQKTGTFGYHNHEKSDDRGFIRVIDPANLVPDIDKTKLGQRAVRDTLLAMLDARDPNSIFTVIDAIRADADLSLDCHDIAHDIGHRAYEFYGFSEAMTFGNPEHLKHMLPEYICAGGYLHGVVEELFLHQKDFKTRPDLACSAVPGDYRTSCFHGIGHAIMFSDKRIVSSALGDCRNVAQSKDMYRCFEGVWMEFFWGNPEHATTTSLGWSADAPLASCIDAAKDEKPTCLLYAPFGYLRTHTKDYSGAVRMCTENGLQEIYAGFCLKGLGITMMSKFNGRHLEHSEVYVAGRPYKEKLAFYQGVLGYARLSGVSEKTLASTCALLQSDTDVCLEALRDST